MKLGFNWPLIIDAMNSQFFNKGVSFLESSIQEIWIRNQILNSKVGILNLSKLDNHKSQFESLLVNNVNYSKDKIFSNSKLHDMELKSRVSTGISEPQPNLNEQLEMLKLFKTKKNEEDKLSKSETIKSENRPDSAIAVSENDELFVNYEKSFTCMDNFQPQIKSQATDFYQNVSSYKKRVISMIENNYSINVDPKPTAFELFQSAHSKLLEESESPKGINALFISKPKKKKEKEKEFVARVQSRIIPNFDKFPKNVPSRMKKPCYQSKRRKYLTENSIMRALRHPIPSDQLKTMIPKAIPKELQQMGGNSLYSAPTLVNSIRPVPTNHPGNVITNSAIRISSQTSRIPSSINPAELKVAKAITHGQTISQKYKDSHTIFEENKTNNPLRQLPKRGLK